MSDFDYDLACNTARRLFEGRITCTVNVLTMPGADAPALWVNVSGSYIAALMPTNYVRGGGWLVAESDGMKRGFAFHCPDLPTAVDRLSRRRHAIALDHKSVHGPDTEYFAITGTVA